ncbi:hypothetical protein AIGOOFII_2429 [Methylobacterium marchantiae]|nr:hypothetical protein AIGOOFII_2429 [Methylobacterium marchantiae]
MTSPVPDCMAFTFRRSSGRPYEATASYASAKLTGCPQRTVTWFLIRS